MDIVPIDEIYRKDPEIGIPSLEMVIVNTTLVDETGKVVGYGVVKEFCEAILKLDPDLRKREKVEALQAAMKVAINNSRVRGVEYLYIISNSPEFTRVLQKQYSFRSCPGELLVLDLKESHG